MRHPMLHTKQPRIYYRNEFEKLLRFCWLTTNLEEKQEKFLVSISDSKTITIRQMQFLQELGIICAETIPYQRRLHNVKFLTEAELQGE